jgi:hypothetical protein
MTPAYRSSSPRRPWSEPARRPRHARTARFRETSLALAAVAIVLGVVLVVALARGGSTGEMPRPGVQHPATAGATGSSTTTTSSAVGPKSTTAAVAADPFGAAAESYVAGRTGTISAAAYDLQTGQDWTLGDGAPQDTASVVKVVILEALLARSDGAGLSSSQQSLAQSMIELSDNASTTELWDQAGGAAGLGSFDSSAGLTDTTPSPCVECPGFPWPGWGLTTTTPSDQIALLRLLVESNALLTTSERQYALNLMENVTSSEQWGVTGDVPTGVTVALKNGWLPLNAADSDWQINSIGWVSGAGRDYLLAVLTTGDPSEQYGIDTIEGLSGMVWRALS